MGWTGGESSITLDNTSGDTSGDNNDKDANAVKRRVANSLQKDRLRHLDKVVTEAKSLIESDPKRSFQLLSCWYKRHTGVNLPLARCEMEDLEEEYSELYRAAPSVGDPLRGQLGDGFDIPDTIPEEEEIR